MTVSKKTRTLNNKIEWNKAWYDLDRQPAKMLALSSAYVGKYDC